MSNLIISDTSCLIALYRIDQINLLQKLFESILITDIVNQEFGLELPAWIRVVEVRNKETIQRLETNLDSGEASAIALSLEWPDCTLIMDEKKGRKIALSLNIKIIGTLRVIKMAHQQGLIESITPVIQGLENAGFRFSKKLIKSLLKSDED